MQPLTTEIKVIVIAFTAAAVMASAVAVVLTVVVVSVHGEDRHGELPHQPPTLIARGVRKLTGLRICQPGQAELQQTPFMQKATGQVHRAQPATSPARVIGQPTRTPASTVSDSGHDTVTGNRRSA